MSNSAVVYGGDEINAIVLDAGSYSTRIGYAGDDFPKIITPLYCAKGPDKMLFGGAIEHPQAGLEVVPLMKDSVVQDWDGALAMYLHCFDKVLQLDQKEQPILITEPVWTSKEHRQKLVESFFELFDFPALYLARTPACVSFQQGRLTCLVVDVGHDSASVTPVVDGICLLKNSMRTHYAGRYINDQIKSLLDTKFPNLAVERTYRIKSKNPTVYPAPASYETRSLPEITQSFDTYQAEKVYSEFKELLLEAPDRKLRTPATNGTQTLRDELSRDQHKRSIEFPSGQSVEVLVERFQMADSLFEPADYPLEEALQAQYPPCNGELDISSPYDDYRPVKRARKAEEPTPTPAPELGQPSVRGLTAMVSHCINSVDIDLRTAISHNIIVTGGLLLIPRLTERLNNELMTVNPGLKVRLHAVGNTYERLNQAWIGGSVLALLGTFHQMWVSKAEYEEAGAEKIFLQRFR